METAANNAQCKDKVAAILREFQGSPPVRSGRWKIPGGPGEEEERWTTAGSRLKFQFSGSPYISERGGGGGVVGEVMEGPWVGAGFVPWAGDLNPVCQLEHSGCETRGLHFHFLEYSPAK